MTHQQRRLALTSQAQQIVGGLSLEEKVHLMSGQVDVDTITREFFAANPQVHYNWYPYPAGGNQRKGIPAMKFCDGPRGVVSGQSTCFPVAMARGATFAP